LIYVVSASTGTPVLAALFILQLTDCIFIPSRPISSLYILLVTKPRKKPFGILFDLVIAKNLGISLIWR
jgi:hypothetical protein